MAQAAPLPVPLGKRLKRRARYVVVRLAIALVSALPLGAARAFGRFLGRTSYALAGKERQKALDSLARAFPEKSDAERAKIARACFEHLGHAVLELVNLAKVDIETLVEFPPKDRQLLDEALARKKGVVFVSGHVGSWELLARRVALAGYPSQSIAKETTDPKLTELITRFRQEGQVGSIWRGQPGAAKQMLRALKAGEILGLLIDQDTRVQSVFVPFFGHRASTPRAAADLALRTGAAVITGFCHRQPDGRYRIALAEIPVTPTDDREADVLQLTAELTARIENAIREKPEQWVWMHRRWKTQ